MIHRFVDLLAGLPDCAYVVSADDGSNFWKSIWVAGHGFTPRELVGTRLDTFSLGRQFGSPTLSPDRTKVLYSTVPADGSINTLDVRGVNDSGHVQIASYANANAGGVDKGLQGSWHPDGTKVVYVESVGAADTSQWIRSVNIDGTGDTGLYSNNRSANGYAMFPAYNYDGSRIAFYKVGDTLWTMLADGTGATQFDSRTAFTETPIAWANTQDVLAWEDTGAVYKKANGDGTGITTLWTDPNPFWGNTRFAWLPDDSGLIVLRRVPADPDPKFILTVIDAAGGGVTDLSPERRSKGGRQEGEVPRVFRDRIWWAIVDPSFTNDTQIVSVLPDGTGYTVEDTIEDITSSQFFDGFDGSEI